MVLQLQDLGGLAHFLCALFALPMTHDAATAHGGFRQPAGFVSLRLANQPWSISKFPVAEQSALIHTPFYSSMLFHVILPLN